MNYNSISSAIRTARTNAKLSQKNVAEYLNKSQATVAAWETGRSQPDASTIVELAKLFHVSTDYLLGVSLVNTPSYSNLFSKELQIQDLSEDNRRKINDFLNEFFAFCATEGTKELFPSFPLALDCLLKLLKEVSCVTESFRTCQSSTATIDFLVSQGFYDKLSTDERDAIEKLTAIAAKAPPESIFAYDSLTHVANCAGLVSMFILQLKQEFSNEAIDL